MQSINHQCSQYFPSKLNKEDLDSPDSLNTGSRWTLPLLLQMQSSPLLPFPHFSQLPVLPKISQSRFSDSVFGAACSFCPSISCVTCPYISAKSGLIAHTPERRQFVLKNTKRVSCRICAATLFFKQQPHKASSKRALKDETLSVSPKVPSLTAVCRRLRFHCELGPPSADCPSC